MCTANFSRFNQLLVIFDVSQICSTRNIIMYRFVCRFAERVKFVTRISGLEIKQTERNKNLKELKINIVVKTNTNKKL